MADDLKELRQLFADDTAEWDAIRKEGAKDMRYASGDPWEPEDRRKREEAGRPCLSLDELSQFTNQIINEIRANKRAVKFSPVGDGANDKTAAFYADKMREIEYRSRAQIAYTTAFENAVQRSYGFVRVSTRYESSRSLNQDIWIDAVHNPDLVTPDPSALMPDLSDMKRCWIREPWRTEDFNRRWPKAKLEGRALTQLAGEAPTWVSKNQVWVSEYWKVTTKPRTLVVVQPAQVQQPGAMLNLQEGQQAEPQVFFADELGIKEPKIGMTTPAGTILDVREKVDDPTVTQCLTNGVDILDETAWKGRYIPIIGCLGKVLYLDEGAGSKRKILSAIRLARDPFMLYCYYRTCEAELVGMTPKFPYFVRRGSLSPDQLLALQKSLHEPVAVVEVENDVEGRQGNPPEFPVRQPYEPPIAALEVGAESARRAIQAAIGQSPLPTQAQRRNEKSGVALRQIEESGQRGSFHFTDHYLDMLTQVGIVVEDLIPHIYDTARQVGIRKANDEAETVWINNPNEPDAVSTKGTHLVTVSTGPSFESERAAASEFADTLASISPEIFGLLGPLIVKLKNLGPIGDEMIELLETVQPPPVQALRDKKKQPNDPAALQQALEQTKAQLEQVMQAAGEMQKALESEQAKQQATIEKAKIDAGLAIQLQRIKNAATIRVAEIAAEVKGLQTGHDAEHEELALGVKVIEAEKDRQHEREMADSRASLALLQGERSHEQGIEQGAMSHQQALEAEQARAAMQPPEGAGA